MYIAVFIFHGYPYVCSDCYEQDFNCCECVDGGKGKWDTDNAKCLCGCCCDPFGGPADSSCNQRSTEVF